MSLLHSRRLRILLPLVIFLFGCFNSPPSPEIVEPQRANVVVMGALAKQVPFAEDHWQAAMRERIPAKLLAVNQRAFALGYAAIP